MNLVRAFHPRLTVRALAALALVTASACSDRGTTASIASPTVSASHDVESLADTLYTPIFADESNGLQAPEGTTLSVGVGAEQMYALAGPNVIVNGSFESAGAGSFAGWTIVNAGNGTWQTYTGTNFHGFSVAAPTTGTHAAMTQQTGPGAHFLYQNVTVPANGVLEFDVANYNRSGSFTNGVNLLHTTQNQRSRVDIMTLTSPVNDLGAGVLLNVFTTVPGNPLLNAYRHITANLSAFAGQTVRLRFAEVDNQGYYQMGVDNVTLTGGDDTPPVVTATVTGTQGANEWYTSNVDITFTATDADSPITSAPCATVTVSNDTAGATFSCTATSAGGSTTKSVTVKRDAQSPVIVSVLTGSVTNGWYTSSVGVIWTVTAGLSGAPGCSSAPVTTDGLNITFTCSTTAGNGKSASATTAPVKRDATKPVIGYSNNVGTYSVDQSVAINCSATDNLSGLASNTCANVSGAGYTFALGVNNFSATAIDNAGNSSTATTSFTVTVSAANLCTLVERWVDNKGIANSMCVKLTKGNYEPFKNELSAQSGKGISAANAATLLRLVNAL